MIHFGHESVGASCAGDYGTKADCFPTFRQRHGCRRGILYGRKGLGEADAVRLRRALAERMEKTSSWLRHERRPGYGVERHFSSALAALFLNSAGFRQAPRCYVTALGMPRAVPFIPLLADLAAKGPSLSVALMVLSIGSVSPDYPFLEFGVGALHACLRRFPDDTKFWVDYGVGKKFCGSIEGIIRAKGSKALDDRGVRAPVEETVSNLIRLGRYR